jgi:hypothetical protein
MRVRLGHRDGESYFRLSARAVVLRENVRSNEKKGYDSQTDGARAATNHRF